MLNLKSYRIPGNSKLEVASVEAWKRQSDMRFPQNDCNPNVCPPSLTICTSKHWNDGFSRHLEANDSLIIMVAAVEWYLQVNTHPKRSVLDVEFQGTLGEEEVDDHLDIVVKSSVEDTKTNSEDGHGDVELAFCDVDLERNLPNVRVNWDSESMKNSRGEKDVFGIKKLLLVVYKTSLCLHPASHLEGVFVAGRAARFYSGLAHLCGSIASWCWRQRLQKFES